MLKLAALSFSQSSSFLGWKGHVIADLYACSCHVTVRFLKLKTQYLIESIVRTDWVSELMNS